MTHNHPQKVDFLGLTKALQHHEPSRAITHQEIQEHATNYKSPYTRPKEIPKPSPSAPVVSTSDPPPHFAPHKRIVVAPPPHPPPAMDETPPAAQTTGETSQMSPYSEFELEKKKEKKKGKKRKKKKSAAEPVPASSDENSLTLASPPEPPTLFERAKQVITNTGPVRVPGFYVDPTAGMEGMDNAPRPKKKSERDRPVTFEDQLSPSRQLKQRNRYSLKDGSLSLGTDEVEALINNLKNAAIRASTYSEHSNYEQSWNLGENQSDTSITSTDSISSLRNLRMKREETLEEYLKHRTNFLRQYAVFIIGMLVTATLSCLFIFWTNYGFQISSPEDHLKNKKLEEHDWSRFHLNCHMLIMIIGVSQLSTVAGTLYRLFPNISRTDMKWLHGSLETISFVLSVSGIYCAWSYHDISGSPHLYSVHTYVGVLGCVQRVVTTCIGFVYVLPFSWDLRVTLIPFHRYAGSLLLYLEICAVVTGCVQMADKYFDVNGFPNYYKEYYWSLGIKTRILNSVALSCLVYMYIVTRFVLGNFNFRRRRKPNHSLTDPDLEHISRVQEKRKSRAIAHEAAEELRGDEVQLSSRKSFNLGHKKHWMHYVPVDKSIPLLINEAEKKKANYTDTDCNFLLLNSTYIFSTFVLGTMDNEIKIFSFQF